MVIETLDKCIRITNMLYSEFQGKGFDLLVQIKNVC